MALKLGGSLMQGIMGNMSEQSADSLLDDSELTISYIETPYLKAPGVQYASKKFEFPKKYNVQGLYKMLQTVAYNNFERLNNL